MGWQSVKKLSYIFILKLLNSRPSRLNYSTGLDNTGLYSSFTVAQWLISCIYKLSGIFHYCAQLLNFPKALASWAANQVLQHTLLVFRMRRHSTLIPMMFSRYESIQNYYLLLISILLRLWNLHHICYIWINLLNVSPALLQICHQLLS